MSLRANLKKTWSRSRVMTSRTATLKMTSFLGSVSSEKHGAARRQRSTVAQPSLLRLKPGSLGAPQPHSRHKSESCVLPRRLTDVQRYILHTFLSDSQKTSTKTLGSAANTYSRFNFHCGRYRIIFVKNRKLLSFIKYI